MKGLIKSNDVPRWVTLLLLLYACYMVFHALFFLAGNGICAGNGTGLIHGTPADGAGALPRIIELESYTRLRPSRPWLSWSDLLAFCFVASSCIWLGVAILSTPFAKKKILLLRKMLFISALIIITLLISALEQSTSCNLRNTHSNIEAIFQKFLVQGSSLQGKTGITEINSLGIDISVEGKYLYELRGRNGEPTCRAYVVKQPQNIASGSIASFNSYTTWSELPEGASGANSRLNEIFSQNLDSNKYRRPMYVSVKRMKIDLPKPLTKALSSDIYHSAIVCSEWPHGWWNEIE